MQFRLLYTCREQFDGGSPERSFANSPNTSIRGWMSSEFFASAMCNSFLGMVSDEQMTIFTLNNYGVAEYSINPDYLYTEL